MQETLFPVAVPEEHLRTIRRWFWEMAHVVQRWPALEALVHSGRIEDARAAELLWQQSPLIMDFPPAEQEAASAFYFWIKSWYLFPVAVPEEHLRTIRRWFREMAHVVQRWPALEALLHSGKIEDACAAELLWQQSPLIMDFPPTEQEAASAFYFWIKSWYPPELAHYETEFSDTDLEPTAPDSEASSRPSFRSRIGWLLSGRWLGLGWKIRRR